MSDPLVRVSGLSLLDGEPDEQGRLLLARLDVLGKGWEAVTLAEGPAGRGGDER
ncbi:hypothetical protein [Azospirillum brasilense]|uniref:hypothetical protein n=1 Tax=Azospirillum brasilense TaxID=192 RepID=UPI001EDA26E9|nr:hypothetical protein [Azospirillum brasilense]UKJ74518.1 hypothetical protein H1Q64_18340 [Azospirillum brasilense]